MKKTLLTLLSVLFCAITFAQSVPQGINYQAVGRDASGDVLMNQALTIQFSVISDITTSVVSWQETHSVNTNAYGLYTAIIGQGTATSVGSSATFDVIDWGASNHLLKVEVDYGGGFVDMGTTAFMSVPYSIYSANPGPQGIQGVPGVDGDDGQNGLDGQDGIDGQGGVTVGGSGVGVYGLGTVNDPYIIYHPSPFYQIGSFAQGGVIYYLTPDGKHGLVAALQDQSQLFASATWNNLQSIISDTSNHSLEGQQFTDWRLPNKHELNIMYLSILQSTGGNHQMYNSYWSSSELSGTYNSAWYQDFSNGLQSTYPKYMTLSVRAIRSF